jgi:phosphate transport system permease protein
MASQQNSGRDSILDEVLGRSISDPNAHINLDRKPRPFERFIQGLLLASGILSIFTTLGIILVLVSESANFFTRQLWEESNRPIAEPIDAVDTVFHTEARGRQVAAGQFIRLSEEVMLVEQYDRNEIIVNSTGTGGGFALFCSEVAEERTDINDASRPITTDEQAQCESNGITPVELRIGTDALAIVVNPSNDFVDSLSFQDLALIFGGAETWADVRSEWPNQPIMRVIPGEDSGTLDYFAEEVFGDDTSIPLGTAEITSEDDEQLARNVRENEYAIGFFGYAYFAENQDTLRAIPIEGVTPEAATVEDATYPLARPLFIYTSEEILAEKEQVAAFVSYYLTHINDVIEEVGYFPASDAALQEGRERFADVTGEDLHDGLLEEVDAGAVNGEIRVAGSSTVFPLSEAIAEIFQEDGFLPRLEVTRGLQETEAVPHPAGVVIEIGDRATIGEFLTNDVWQPAIREFGILPLIYGTLATSVIAMLVALPLGIGAAIYLSEYAPENVRSTLKPILEILAGIPTVVYGYFALTFMTPLLRSIFGIETVEVYNSASGGIVVGILIIPLVASMSEDALRAVPRALREASYGLGATKLETTIKVVLPAALSGILAAFIVAISRAVGETMIVAIAAGAGPQNNIAGLLRERGPGIIFEPAETMTGHMARISGGDLSYDSIDYVSIFAIGLTLFLITLVLNLISRQILNRFREAY